MTAHKVAVTLPEELYELVERARAIEHRTRSEVIQDALRTHFGEAIYVPTEEEKRLLIEALYEVEHGVGSLHDWAEVRESLRSRG